MHKEKHIKYRCLAKTAFRVFVFGMFLFVARYAFPQDLEREAEELRQTTKETLDNYSDVNHKVSDRIIIEHILLGKVAIEERRFDEAIKMLTIPAMSDRFEHHRGRAEALTLLSEALLQKKMFRLARHFASRALDRNDGGDELRAHAAAIWISASISMKKLDEIEGVEGTYAIRQKAFAGQQSEGFAELTYQYARALIILGRRAEAVALLGTITKEHAVYAQAKYALATAFALDGKLDEAYALFYELSDWRNIDNRLHPDVRKEIAAQANLSRGRIALEQNNFKKSWDGYSLITKNSLNYQEALYETVWLFEKRGFYDEARKSAVVYLQLLPPHKHSAWTQILPGILLRNAKEYEKSKAYFADLAEKFSNIEYQMAKEIGPLNVYLLKLSKQISERGSKAIAEQPEFIGVIPGITVLCDASLKLHELNTISSDLGELLKEHKRLAGIIEKNGVKAAKEIDLSYGFLKDIKARRNGLAESLKAASSGSGDGSVKKFKKSSKKLGESDLQRISSKLYEVDQLIAEFESDIKKREALIFNEINQVLKEEQENAHIYDLEIKALTVKISDFTKKIAEYSGAHANEKLHKVLMRAEYGQIESVLSAKEEAANSKAQLYEERNSMIDNMTKEYYMDMPSADREELSRLLGEAPSTMPVSETPASKPIDTVPQVPPIQIQIE